MSDPITLRIRVQPRASKNEITGCREGVWIVRLTAPPVDGAANRACTGFLAECLGIRRSQVRLVAGEKSRDKMVAVQGLTYEEARKRLSE